MGAIYGTKNPTYASVGAWLRFEPRYVTRVRAARDRTHGSRQKPARTLQNERTSEHISRQLRTTNSVPFLEYRMRVVSRLVLLAASLGAMAPLANAGEVSVGVTITGEIVPGVYGRVDLANRPPPQLVYATPVVIVQPPPRVVVEPIYLHVPPGHARNWSKHCREYQACNRPVYFVKSAEYEPGYKPGRGKGGEHGDDHGHRGNGRH